MANKKDTKAKSKPKRKAPPKATMDVKVTGKLKCTQNSGRYGYSEQATFNWELTDNHKIVIERDGCGEKFTFDKKTISQFADLIGKAGSAKVVFE